MAITPLHPANLSFAHGCNAHTRMLQAKDSSATVVEEALEQLRVPHLRTPREAREGATMPSFQESPGSRAMLAPRSNPALQQRSNPASPRTAARTDVKAGPSKLARDSTTGYNAATAGATAPTIENNTSASV